MSQENICFPRQVLKSQFLLCQYLRQKWLVCTRLGLSSGRPTNKELHISVWYTNRNMVCPLWLLRFLMQCVRRRLLGYTWTCHLHGMLGKVYSIKFILSLKGRAFKPSFHEKTPLPIPSRIHVYDSHVTKKEVTTTEYYS